MAAGSVVFGCSSSSSSGVADRFLEREVGTAFRAKEKTDLAAALRGPLGGEGSRQGGGQLDRSFGFGGASLDQGGVGLPHGFGGHSRVSSRPTPQHQARARKQRFSLIQKSTPAERPLLFSPGKDISSYRLHSSSEGALNNVYRGLFLRWSRCLKINKLCPSSCLTLTDNLSRDPGGDALVSFNTV